MLELPNPLRWSMQQVYPDHSLGYNQCEDDIERPNQGSRVLHDNIPKNKLLWVSQMTFLLFHNTTKIIEAFQSTDGFFCCVLCSCLKSNVPLNVYEVWRSAVSPCLMWMVSLVCCIGSLCFVMYRSITRLLNTGSFADSFRNGGGKMYLTILQFQTIPVPK